MNPKIKKLRAEHEKNSNKISELQGKNQELEKKIRELEDIEIVGIVREFGMSIEQLSNYLKEIKNSPAFNALNGQKNNEAKEENSDEKI